MKRATILSGLVLLSPVVAAGEPEDCTTIEDPEARLACYDQRYSRPSEGASEVTDVPPRTAEPPSPATAIEPVVAAERQPAPPAEVKAQDEGLEDIAAEATAAAAASKDSDRAGLFDLDERVDLTSTIAAVLAKPQQKMVFRLENEQIWMQSSPRLLRIREGDRVTIRNASVGGYLLRTESGVTTRVERIK